MSGYVDLHLHYVPGVDDGVRSASDGVALLKGLHGLGFRRAIATPHIRSGMFPNERAPLVDAFDAFARDVDGDVDIPALGLGAEHWVDESLLERVSLGNAIPYPGQRAILIELPPQSIPLGLPTLCFRLLTKRLTPVIAHPERYAALYERSSPLAAVKSGGAAMLLDLMSLTEHYGRAPRRAAERMLDEGFYDAACSDSHGPADVGRVEKAIAMLEKRVGREACLRLLSSGPTSILAGTIGT